ncbi:MAG: DHHA1 domain-containing protein [Arcobacteraceae bacterium]|jgi:oligoribonuclease NrnB/cAMP/cGMP phosphodiesterase (DHH superfamily)|nr:DHHA1 domain-containing protein [Arcobacteraceae bacterium]
MIKIIYHKNCMDGLASAFIARTTLEKREYEVQCIALQYGEESILFGRNEKQALLEPLSKEDVIYFVDFSLKRDLMIELSSMVKEIVILDHHKTAEENLRGLEEELENITIIFDMNKSGATLCYEYFFDSGLTKKEVFNYIADRDLWKWEIPQSKEINEYLRFIIKPNDLESFKNMYASFHESWFSENGSLLLSQINKQVASKVKKVQDIKILDIDFKIINATENISELGNKICEEYNTPAIIYFITENNEVVLSFRSLDTLPDVSIVAAALGGGGHRNACGCTLSLSAFMELINETKIYNDRLAELEKVILDYYLAKGYEIGVSGWAFNVEIESEYKSKSLLIYFRENLHEHYLQVFKVEVETTKEMFDKAIEFFQLKK